MFVKINFVFPRTWVRTLLQRTLLLCVEIPLVVASPGPSRSVCADSGLCPPPGVGPAPGVSKSYRVSD